MNLNVCLVLFTFEAIQLVIVITFIKPSPEIAEVNMMNSYACLMVFISGANRLVIYMIGATCIFPE